MRFQQDSWVRVQQRTITSHGRLRGARPDHVRFDYDGSGPIVVANGDAYLYYQPGDASFPGQVTRGTNDAVSAAFSVLVGGVPLDRDFSIGACASVSGTAPAGTTCIELHPRAAHAAFERLRMYVLTADDVRGRLGHLDLHSLDQALSSLPSSGPPYALVVDVTSMTDYDREARERFVAWNSANRDRVKLVAIVTTNALWGMVIRAMSLASAQRMRGFPTLDAAR